jgi:hypothetical protein
VILLLVCSPGVGYVGGGDEAALPNDKVIIAVGDDQISSPAVGCTSKLDAIKAFLHQVLCISAPSVLLMTWHHCLIMHELIMARNKAKHILQELHPAYLLPE